MSGGTLPRTGVGVITLGAGSYAVGVPLPVALLVAGVGLVLIGAMLVRLSFRRRRPAGVR